MPAKERQRTIQAGRFTKTNGSVRQTAVTATADGLTTGLIPKFAGHVLATAGGDADAIVTLPTAAAADVGEVISLYIGATGCEVRTPATSGATINTVDSDGTNELAIAATSLIFFMIIAADTWMAWGWGDDGTALAALTPD